MATTTTAAQDEPEYRMELGGGLGTVAYEGDFNGSVLSGMRPMAGLLAKYKINPRMAWSAQLGFGKLKGSSKDVKTWYPDIHDNPLEFETSLTAFTLRYEYNFWPFGTGKEYLGAKPLTPFFAFGLGLAFTGTPKLTRKETLLQTETDDDNNLPTDSYTGPSWEPAGATVAFQMPIGLGVKYKLADRINLTAEWMMHFTGSDKLDGVADPYGIKSSGLFKNTDCYSTLQVSLTYEMWEKCKTCNNDRD